MVVNAVMMLDELLPLNMIGVKKIQGGALEVYLEQVFLSFAKQYCTIYYNSSAHNRCETKASCRSVMQRFTRSPPVNTCFTWCGTTVLNGGILMKFGTNIHHLSGNCWKGSQGQSQKCSFPADCFPAFPIDLRPLPCGGGILIDIVVLKPTWLYYGILLISSSHVFIYVCCGFPLSFKNQINVKCFVCIFSGFLVSCWRGI